MIPVEVQAFAHLTHIAGLGVALEVEGNIHTGEVGGILHFCQADAGADAVAQGNIGDGVGLLLFFGAAGGEETVLLLCGGLFSGQSGVCVLFRGGCKGRNAQDREQHGG